MCDNLLIFTLGGRERYALPVAQIREIVRLETLNQVPGSSAVMLGLARVRDLYVPVIDTRAVIFRQPKQAEAKMAIILDLPEPIALAAHEVSQVVKGSNPMESQASSHGRFVEGVLHDEHGIIQKLIPLEIVKAFQSKNNQPDEGAQNAA